MIYLHQGPRAWGQPNVSPFCTKVELFLRAAGIRYEVRPWSPIKAPKGKMPFIVDEGTTVADSALILEHLTRKHGVTLDQHLSERDRAIGHAVRRMLEEATDFCGVYFRWGVDDNFAAVRQAIFGKAPSMVRLFVAPLLRRKMLRSLAGQGTSRHSSEEVAAFAKSDFEALRVFLEPGPYLLGDRFTSYDCTVYAFIDALLAPPLKNPLAERFRSDPVFANYHERIRAQYFTEFRRVGS